MSIAQKFKADLEKVAHFVVAHAKEVVVALHGEEKAKEALPILGGLIADKAQEILGKAEKKL